MPGTAGERHYRPVMTVHTEIHDSVLVVTIDRPERRNAVDGPTATELFEAFTAFEEDDSLSVAILTGANGTFCAGADLKAISTGNGNLISISDVDDNGDFLYDYDIKLATDHPSPRVRFHDLLLPQLP